MFGLLLLCCCSFSLLHFSSSLVHGNIQLDNGPAGGHRTDSPYLSDIDQGSVKGCWFSNSPCPMCYHVYSANDKLEKPTDTPAERVGKSAGTAVLNGIGRSHVPDPMQEAGLGPIDSVEDHFLMDAGSYDEDSSAALQLQGRAMRSPRRCIPHQQSCLGYPLPCCDPCDTCYCRFFNAICYCRRVGHTCPTRRT